MNLDVGLPKPSEYDVSICITLSRSPIVGGTGGALQCVADTLTQAQLGICPLRRFHRVWRSTER